MFKIQITYQSRIPNIWGTTTDEIDYCDSDIAWDRIKRLSLPYSYTLIHDGKPIVDCISMQAAVDVYVQLSKLPRPKVGKWGVDDLPDGAYTLGLERTHVYTQDALTRGVQLAGVH